MSGVKDLVDELKSLGGYWTETLDPLIDTAPEFVRAYAAFAAHPCRMNLLPARVRNFVGLAVHAAATHLHRPGVRFHMRGALEAGASVAEIIEVLELTATLGVHASVFGVPLLLEAAGGLTDGAPRDARRERLKADFLARRGYWSPIWEGMLALDPDYFQAFTAFSSAPWASTALDPKVKELIYIATGVSATHLFAPGVPIHIANALKYGASPGEILEVMQIASTIGINSFEVALPILAEELDRAGKPNR